MHIFKFTDSSVEDLCGSLDSGPILKLKEEVDGIHEKVILQKQRISSFESFSVHIYADEHPPPHFHIKYNGDSNSFEIESGKPLYPRNGLSRYFKNIKKWHRKNKKKLIDAWNLNRPSDCAVGPINF